MQKDIKSIFYEYMKLNFSKKSYCPVSLDEVVFKNNVILIKARFLNGNTYCCAEPGCHFGFNDPLSWSLLRKYLKPRDILIGGELAVKIKAVVERGANLESNKTLGLSSIVSNEYHYSCIYKEKRNSGDTLPVSDEQR
jgi:hypothetical protein